MKRLVWKDDVPLRGFLLAGLSYIHGRDLLEWVASQGRSPRTLYVSDSPESLSLIAHSFDGIGRSFNRSFLSFSDV
jgi:hypothetical protein